jgi:hypothetical protein
MGYNTGIIILNDAVHSLPEDKEFGRKLHDAILAFSHRRIDVAIGCHVNACQVICQEHADVEMIVGIGGNSGRILGSGGCYNSQHMLLHRLAEQHGFKLVPDPKARPSSITKERCDDCVAGAVHGTCYDCGKILTKDLSCPDKPGRHRR